MRYPLAAIAAALALAAPAAEASIVADTGVVLPFTGGLSISPDQWAAARFDVTRATTLTDAEGYFGFGSAGDALTLALRADTPGGPGAELYSASFRDVSSTDGWRGLHGLAWNVSAGLYWLAFEVRDGQTFDNAFGLPAAPAVVATGRPPTSPYVVAPGGLGPVAFRVSGQLSGAPEPMAWTLMIAGFAGVGAAMRLRRPLGRTA